MTGPDRPVEVPGELRIAQVLTASTGGIGRHVASMAVRMAAAGHQVQVFCTEQTAVSHDFSIPASSPGSVVVRPLRALLGGGSGLAPATGSVSLRERSDHRRSGRAVSGQGGLDQDEIELDRGGFPSAERAGRGPMKRRAAGLGLGSFDIVHAHGYKATVLAGPLATLSRRPLVSSWHNAILATGYRGVSGRALQRVSARMADLTLGASSDLVAQALALGARRARLGPVAAPAVPAPTEARSVTRSRLGIDDNQILILTVGRLAPQKNLAMLTGIAARLRSRADLRFLIAGEGPERTRLSEQIASGDLAVTLLGTRSDIPDLLQAADLALLTSTWEARALVAQEALRAGVPLISTRVGGIAELVGDAAVLVDLNATAEAATALLALADNPGYRERLRRRGLARAQTWPDEDAVATAVLACYAELR